MQPETNNLTILGTLLQAFSSCSQSKHFSKVYTERLSLFVLERQDKNLAYVTDGHHTILALASKMKQELNIHPTNVLCNRFYNFQQKTYLFLNFTQETPAPEPHLMHPYTPHYYFKERFNQFIKVRSTLKMPKPCQQLILQKWQFALVNVNAQGYYAPAIIIHQYKKNWHKNPPNYETLNCILYQYSVQTVLQQLRLNDFREYFAKKVPKSFQVSLFYFARNKIATPIKSEGSLIVCIDKDKQILNFSQDRANHIILASNQLQGLCSFMDTKQKQLTEEDSLKIQQRHLIELFNGLDLSNEKKESLDEFVNQKVRYERENREDRAGLWADTSSQSSENEDEKTGKMDIEITENEEEQSQEEEDPLKNLYMKHIKKEMK